MPLSLFIVDDEYIALKRRGDEKAELASSKVAAVALRSLPGLLHPFFS